MTFEDLIKGSTRFNREEFVQNLGGIVEDVADLLNSDMAKSALREARDYIDSHAHDRLPNDMNYLMDFSFGDIHSTDELIAGQVAAVDGTPVLPMQKYSAGQALCVGIASRSYTRQMDDALHGYTSKVILDGLSVDRVGDIRTYIQMVQEGIYSISQTAYMRYFEAVHALSVKEPYIFCDGTLLYEWLINQDIGRELYKQFLSKKKAIGVMKSLKENPHLSWLGRALKPGELFVWETLYEHISRTQEVPRLDRSERLRETPQWENDKEFVELAKKVYRGVFKPSQKAFGFECYIDHFDPMLKIMAADCQMNHIGHEIPFLLNQVDLEIRRFFKSDVVRLRIQHRMSQDGESLFLEESDERDFR